MPDPFTDPTTSRTWRIAATAIAVTAMSSSGIAAAATGDPLAPFNYVATALGNITPTDRADQIRFGMPAMDLGQPATGPDQAGSDSAGVIDTYWPQPINGRHRADDGASEPRHRANESTRAASDDDGSGYKPRHVADQPQSTGGQDAAPPAETPPETPPPTPPVEVPPVETPPAAPADPPPATPDPEPTPEPGDGTVVGSPPGDNAPGGTSTDSGSPEGLGDVAADAIAMKMDDPAPPTADPSVDGG